jgi:hypothetical protein
VRVTPQRGSPALIALAATRRAVLDAVPASRVTEGLAGRQPLRSTEAA